MRRFPGAGAPRSFAFTTSTLKIGVSTGFGALAEVDRVIDIMAQPAIEQEKAPAKATGALTDGRRGRQPSGFMRRCSRTAAQDAPLKRRLSQRARTWPC